MRKIFNKLFFVVLFSCSLFADDFDAECEREQRFYNSYRHYISEVVDSVTEQLKTELNFRHGLGNITTHPTEKIEQLEFKFYIPHRATVEEARALLLVALDRCTQTINSHEKIQPFLISKPFPKQERLHISLYFEKRLEDDRPSSYYDGSVTTAFGDLDSFSYIGQTPFTSYINLGEEAFNEATILAAKSPIQDLSVHQSTEREEGLDKIFDQFSKEMEKKFDLRMTIGGNLTQGLWDIEIDAKRYIRASQKDARKFVVLTAQELSDQINSHFKDSVFHPRRLKMKIDFIDRHYRHYEGETMKSVMLDGSEITYLTSEKNACEHETYREAVEIVQALPPDTLLEIVCKGIRNFWDGLVYLFESLWIGFWWGIAILFRWGMN